MSHLQIIMLSDIIPNVVVLSMVYAECRIFYYVKCPHTEYHLSSVTFINYYAECCCTKCGCTEYGLCWVSHFYNDQCSDTDYHLSIVTFTNYYAEWHFTKSGCTEYGLCWVSHFYCDQCLYTQYRLTSVTFINSYAECHYAECHQPKIVSTVFITTNTAV